MTGSQTQEKRIIYRENDSEIADLFKDHIIAFARRNGVQLSKNSFFHDAEDEFDPNILLNFNGAFLHEVSPGELIALIEFLKANPEKSRGIFVYAKIFPKGNEHILNELRSLGVVIDEKDSMTDYERMVNAVLGVEG